MIYRYALSVGVVHPYRLQDSQETGHFTEDATVALLATCRFINTEASYTLYSQNTFFLPDTDLTIKFFANALHSPTRRAWVKSVHLGLGYHDISASNLQTIESKITERHQGNYMLRHYGTRAFQHDAHRCYMRQISWPRKVKLILDFLRLDSLVINFADSRCCRECCSLTASALATFQAGFAHGVPTNLEMYGLTPPPLIYHVENTLRLGCFERALRMWTEQRVQKSLPLSKGFKAMKELVDWKEQEHTRDREVYEFEKEE